MSTSWMCLAGLVRVEQIDDIRIGADQLVPEIAEATGDNVNTIYSRLRVARKEFERARKQYALRSTP